MGSVSAIRKISSSVMKDSIVNSTTCNVPALLDSSAMVNLWEGQIIAYSALNSLRYSLVNYYLTIHEEVSNTGVVLANLGLSGGVPRPLKKTDFEGMFHC